MRELAPDYDVSHTTLSRYFARPEVSEQLKRAERLHRAEQRAAEARLRAELKAEREAARAAQRRARQQPGSGSEALRRRGGAANAGRARSIPPLELEPFSDQWLAWYEARRLFSAIDMLNDNDARRAGSCRHARPGRASVDADLPADSCTAKRAVSLSGGTATRSSQPSRRPPPPSALRDKREY